MARQTYTRNKLYTLLAVGKKQLGWSENIYRAWLHEQGAKEVNGKTSATSMNYGQLFAAVEDMKRRGFTPSRGSVSSGTAGWRQSRIAKLNALWIQLADAGLVRNRAEEAMHEWCRKAVPGLTRLEWATSQQLNHAIEALKAWRDREGLPALDVAG